MLRRSPPGRRRAGRRGRRPSRLVEQLPQRTGCRRSDSASTSGASIDSTVAPAGCAASTAMTSAALRGKSVVPASRPPRRRRTPGHDDDRGSHAATPAARSVRRDRAASKAAATPRAAKGRTTKRSGPPLMTQPRPAGRPTRAPRPAPAGARSRRASCAPRRRTSRPASRARPRRPSRGRRDQRGAGSRR